MRQICAACVQQVCADYLVGVYVVIGVGAVAAADVLHFLTCHNISIVCWGEREGCCVFLSAFPREVGRVRTRP